MFGSDVAARCGEDVAPYQLESAATTVGSRPDASALRVGKLTFKLMTRQKIGVHVQERIAKNTGPGVYFQPLYRLLRRVPKATSRALYGMSLGNQRVGFPVLRGLRITGIKR